MFSNFLRFVSCGCRLCTGWPFAEEEGIIHLKFRSGNYSWICGHEGAWIYHFVKWKPLDSAAFLMNLLNELVSGLKAGIILNCIYPQQMCRDSESDSHGSAGLDSAIKLLSVTPLPGTSQRLATAFLWCKGDVCCVLMQSHVCLLGQKQHETALLQRCWEPWFKTKTKPHNT